MPIVKSINQNILHISTDLYHFLFFERLNLYHYHLFMQEIMILLNEDVHFLLRVSQYLMALCPQGLYQNLEFTVFLVFFGQFGQKEPIEY